MKQHGNLTTYHLKQSKAALEVAESFRKRPASLQEAIAQVQRLKSQSRSTVKKGHSSTN